MRHKTASAYKKVQIQPKDGKQEKNERNFLILQEGDNNEQ